MFSSKENGLDAHSDMYSVDEDLSAQDLVDFSPVYRCLHIHTVLDAKETYESYYRKQRKKQARLAMQPPTNMVFAKLVCIRHVNEKFSIFSMRPLEVTDSISTGLSVFSLLRTT